MPKSEMGQAAINGVAIHSAIETTIKTGNDAFVKPTDRRVATHDASVVEVSHGAWLEYWWSNNKHRNWLAEQAFAIAPASGHVMRLDGSYRDYSRVPDSHVPITIDAVLVEPDRVVVSDVKTGRATHVEAPANNAQLLTGALAATAAFGRQNARLSIVYVSTDSAREVSAEVEGLDLYDWRQELAEIHGTLADAVPNPGPHCRDKYCPLFTACPATRGAIEHIAPARRLPVVYSASDFKSNEHAAEQILTLRTAKEAIARGWGAVNEYAIRHEGIDLGNGKAWAQVETARDKIDLDAPGAVAAIRALFGEHAEKALSYSTTKEALKTAARIVAKEKGATITSVYEEAVGALRRIGAVERKLSTTFDEVKKEESAA